MRFVQIKGDYFALSSIISIRRTPNSVGADDVVRNWVVRVTPEAVGSSTPNHATIWCSDAEVEEALEAIRETSTKQKANDN